MIKKRPSTFQKVGGLVSYQQLQRGGFFLIIIRLYQNVIYPFLDYYVSSHPG